MAEIFPEQLKSPHYLQVAKTAIELENYLNERSKELQRVKELTQHLRKILEVSNLDTVVSHHLYMPLWYAMRKDSDKEIKYKQEFDLEMTLLISELESVEKNINKERFNKIIIPFLGDYSQELIRAEQEYNYRRLVA